MKISYNWLKEYLDLKISAEETADILTNVGLEVEEVSSWESVKGGLKELRVGQVKEAYKHPNADKLSLTKVTVGGKTDLQIVCGAPNVATGQKVIVALEGTLIHPSRGEPFIVRKAKIRGAESQGMICSQDEIGLGSDHSGIVVLPDDATVGTLVSEYYGVTTDSILDIGLTPNRGDAMSHLGVARDLLAFLHANRNEKFTLNIPDVGRFSADDSVEQFKVEIERKDGCLRYSALNITGISVTESPKWLRTHLEAAGLRPINSIVDITNFVMLECGQPLHAFDADGIEGKKVIVKTLTKDSPFLTLDNHEIKLHTDDLMICSATRGMCIAGVYGGLHSGVTSATKNIFLESACFNPKMVRRTSLRHQLRTDAALRFEKGTDPNLTVFALKRAALLIQQISGGKISGITDVYPSPVTEKKVKLTWEKLSRVAGVSVSPDTAVKILMVLGFIVNEQNDKGINVTVPAYKSDVQMAEDVIEEIIRIHGFDKIPLPNSLYSSLTYSTNDQSDAIYQSISEQLVGSGFREIINNSVTNSAYHEKYFPDQKEGLIKLLSFSNAGLDSLRTAMLFTALDSIRHNLNRKLFNLKLFEFGKVYLKERNEYRESTRLVLFVTGNQSEESWLIPEKETDFFFMKGIVRSVLSRSGVTSFSSTTLQNSLLLSGLTYEVTGKQLVSFGNVRPNILSDFDIKKNVWYADFDLEAVTAFSKRTITYAEPSRYPAVRRDLALIIDSQISFSEVEALSHKVAGPLLKKVNLFDSYMDKKLGENKKSYAISFTLEDEQKTLTDQEVEKVMKQLISGFEKELKATIRS